MRSFGSIATNHITCPPVFVGIVSTFLPFANAIFGLSRPARTGKSRLHQLACASHNKAIVHRHTHIVRFYYCFAAATHKSVRCANTAGAGCSSVSHKICGRAYVQCFRVCVPRARLMQKRYMPLVIWPRRRPAPSTKHKRRSKQTQRPPLIFG